MSDKPILLYLHGVGPSDQIDECMAVLAEGLAELGYPDLDSATVIAPRYSNALRGTDDDDPLPSFRLCVGGFLVWLACLGGFQGLVGVVTLAVLAAWVRVRCQVRRSVRVAQDRSRVVPVAWSMVSQAGGRRIR